MCRAARWRSHRFGSGAFVLASALSCAGPPPVALELVSDGRVAMGTVLEVSLATPDRVEARAELDRIYARVAALEARLSRFRSQSDISRLNRAAGGAAVALHPDTLAVLRRAVRAARETDGVFDVCVGPLISVWTRAARSGRLPAPPDLERARGLVDARRIRFLGAGRARLPLAGMSIDLGGIAKGFALDRVVADLRARRVGGVLLSFGESSVWALGAPPGREAWRLLVRAPGGGIAGAVRLRDRAMSVSSSFGETHVIAGRRYGHVIDPRTGWPLSRSVQAIVIAADATAAEVLSTALVVLGPDAGIRLMDSLAGAEARITDADGGVVRSRGWLRATHFEAAAPASTRAPRRSEEHLEGLLDALLHRGQKGRADRTIDGPVVRG